MHSSFRISRGYPPSCVRKHGAAMMVLKQGGTETSSTAIRTREVFFINDFFNMTQKKAGLRSKQQTEQKPQLLCDVINEILRSRAPFARARRHRTACTPSDNPRTKRAWTGLYPNTELATDLKLVTKKQGRMAQGEYHAGMITRDGEDHYTFVENATEERKTTRRNPTIYSGQQINIKRRGDGTLCPTFKRTKGLGAKEMSKYFVKTALELLMVVGKHKAAKALAELEGFAINEVFASDEGLGEEDFGEE